ncbi:MAG TPA: TRZ/ATZ family hydrolase [Woeseiaceae bacterium]|nr:TRZ/ATZ family hydrolase [Woeseiaceae bacterium]
MLQCDLLILPRWCVPVEPGGVLEQHAVAVSDGRIVEVLPAAEARQRYRPGALVERPQHVLIPGLVNAHTHAAMTLFRGIADDLPLERWLADGIWPNEKRWASAEMVRDGTRHAIAEMLLSGVTCFSDQYFFPEVVAATAAECHVRAMVGTPVIDFATAWAGSASEYLRKGAELVHDRYADDPLISTCFTPHSTYVVSDEAFRELRVLADQLDVPVQIHLHETAHEVEDAVRTTGKRPLERLRDLGFLNASLTAVHAVHLTDEEIRQLGEAGVTAVHCPRSNLKLASGIARVPAMRAAGITVGIGTDGAASNNVLDMLGEMRAAALLAKTAAANAAALTAAEALRMATLDGARVLGLDAVTGSITAGKWADLACIDLGTLNSQPVYDPVSQLVYTAHPEQVTDVWVAGRQLVEEHRLLGMDVSDILLRTAEWQQRIAAKTGRES